LGSLSSAAAKVPGAEISGQAAASLGVELDNLTISDPCVASGTPIFYDINFEIGGKIVLAAFGAADADASVSLSYNSVALGSAQGDTNGGESTASGIFSAGISDVKSAHAPSVRRRRRPRLCRLHPRDQSVRERRPLRVRGSGRRGFGERGFPGPVLVPERQPDLQLLRCERQSPHGRDCELQRRLHRQQSLSLRRQRSDVCS
jgi:hypothetical protein